MNDAAQKHLTRAEGHIAKGDGFYAKAADEIIAARQADPTLTWIQIGEQIGRADNYGKRLVSWRTNGTAAVTPFARVEGENTRKDREAAKRIVKTDPHIVVDLFTSLDSEQQEMIAVDLAQRGEFADAVKNDPVVRDELVEAVSASEDEKEESKRRTVKKKPSVGWYEIAQHLGDARRGLRNVTDVLVTLAINARVSKDDDLLQVAHDRAEEIGTEIHEMEMAWGATPISDRIEELRSTIRS